MTNNNETLAGTARANGADVRKAFDTVRKCIVIFGVVGAIVVATLMVIAVTHGSVSTFMWVRAALLLAITPLFSRMVAHAAKRQRKAYERLRTVTLILPIAIIVVDVIPGVCPIWYAAMQAVSAVPLIAIAVITRRGALRAAFPKDA